MSQERQNMSIPKIQNTQEEHLISSGLIGAASSVITRHFSNHYKSSKRCFFIINYDAQNKLYKILSKLHQVREIIYMFSTVG